MPKETALPMPSTLEHIVPAVIKIERDRGWVRAMLVDHMHNLREAAAIERWARSLTTKNCAVSEWDIAQEVLAILERRRQGTAE